MVRAAMMRAFLALAVLAALSAFGAYSYVRVSAPTQRAVVLYCTRDGGVDQAAFLGGDNAVVMLCRDGRYQRYVGRYTQVAR